MSKSSSNSYTYELVTAHQQFTRIVQTLRGICNNIPSYRGVFDKGFREGLVDFDLDDFLSRGSDLLPSDRERAVRRGCALVLEEIDALPANERTQHHDNIYSQLNSDMIDVLASSLHMTKPVSVAAKPSARRPASPRPRKPKRPSPQCNPTDVGELLQSIDIKSIHYRNCRNPNTDCLTCQSAFKLLDYTPCTHNGDWCTSKGWYPHFPARLQRKFRQQHVENRALSQMELDAAEDNASEPTSDASVNLGAPSPTDWVAAMDAEQAAIDAADAAQAEFALANCTMDDHGPQSAGDTLRSQTDRFVAPSSSMSAPPEPRRLRSRFKRVPSRSPQEACDRKRAH